MIIYQHRLNTLEEVMSAEYGLEIDIRSKNNELIITHDAFDESFIYLNEVKNALTNKAVIFNVKEEGLEEKLKPIFSLVDQDNSFILDESIPFIVKYCQEGFCNFSIRVSEIETIHSALKIKEFLNESGAEIDWIWLDCFTLKPASYHILETLKSEGFKICVVSPELHIISRPEEWDELIFNFQDTLGGNVQFVDGICTKNPGIWALNSYSRTTNL